MEGWKFGGGLRGGGGVGWETKDLTNHSLPAFVVVCFLFFILNLFVVEEISLLALSPRF